MSRESLIDTVILLSVLTQSFDGVLLSFTFKIITDNRTYVCAYTGQKKASDLRALHLQTFLAALRAQEQVVLIIGPSLQYLSVLIYFECHYPSGCPGDFN